MTAPDIGKITMGHQHPFIPPLGVHPYDRDRALEVMADARRAGWTFQMTWAAIVDEYARCGAPHDWVALQKSRATELWAGM